MARKKYEPTKRQVNVDTRIQSATLDYSGLAESSQAVSKAVQELTQLGAEYSYGKFKTEAAKKAQRRAVDNDPYIEYYNTKDKMGLEDRLTNELVLTEIGNDYIEDVSILTKEVEIDSLAKAIPGAQFDALLDRKVLDLYQQFRKDKLDSPQLELEARKSIDPYIKRIKIAYREKLLSSLKSKTGTAHKNRGTALAKFAGDLSYSEDGPQAIKQWQDWLEANPGSAEKHALDFLNTYESARFDALITASKSDDLKYNTTAELQHKYNMIKNFPVDTEMANSELYLNKEKVLKQILTQAGVTPEASTEHAEERINMTHEVWVEKHKNDLTPELSAIYNLIDSNIQYLNTGNYRQFIKLHNKTLYPFDVTVREEDGTIPDAGPVELDVPFWRAASQDSLEAYTLKRMEQYKEEPAKFVEALMNKKNAIFDADGRKIQDTANFRKSLDLPIIDATEIEPFLTKVNTLQNRDEAKGLVENFFNQFTLKELESLSYNMLTKLGDDEKQFTTYLNAALVDKLNNNKDKVLDKTFLGYEKIKNAAARPEAAGEEDNHTALQKKIRVYTDGNLTEEMMVGGARPKTVATIENDMIAYIYGNQQIAYGSNSAHDSEVIENAFKAVTGYKEINNEQVHAYGTLGDNESVVHLNYRDREKEFSDMPVSYDTMNDLIDIIDTQLLNDYMYIKDPETKQIIKWGEGYTVRIHPLMGRVFYDDYGDKITPTKEQLEFTGDHLREMSFKNSKTNSNYYTIKDVDNTMIVNYKGRPVELMIDLKKASYDFKKYIEPNLRYVSGANISDDYLVEKGYVNIGPGTIKDATYTRRFLTSPPREGDILMAPDGTKIKYSKLSKTTGMVKNLLEVRDRAITLEKIPGTSFGAMEYGTEFQDFFGENE